MKIYFAGSIRGGREDADLYAQLIAYTGSKAVVLTEHVGAASLDAMGEQKLTDQQIHDRDIAWIDESDGMIAEVTRPSLGVGYEIRYSIDQGKPVLGLYRSEEGKRLSAMISGASGICNKTYHSFSEAQSHIDMFLAVLRMPPVPGNPWARRSR